MVLLAKDEDPADWWKNGVDPENLPNYENEASQPWESPTLAFFEDELKVGVEYDLEKIDPTRAMIVKRVVKGVPQLEVDSGLFKKRFKMGVYLGPADQCRWCPDQLKGDSAIDTDFFLGLFIGKSHNDSSLYVFILSVTYRSLDDFGGGDGPEYA